MAVERPVAGLVHGCNTSMPGYFARRANRDPSAFDERREEQPASSLERVFEFVDQFVVELDISGEQKTG